MLKEFRDFVLRGNVIDLAIGIIIGAAFGSIVTSFVNDILMPPVGLLLGGVDFKDLFITLKGPAVPTLEAAKAAGAVTLNYGLFLNAVISFVLIAFAVFLLIKNINRIKKKEAPVITKDCSYCNMAIPVNASRCPHCTSQLS